MQEDMISVQVSHQPIELCKLLKIANLVGGGGEAKIVISEGYVLLNQVVEYQKRKKVYDQDIVEFNGEIIQVQCSSPVLTPEQTKQKKRLSKANDSNVKTSNNITKKKKAKTAPSNQNTPILTGGRKRISF